jgi:integrase
MPRLPTPWFREDRNTWCVTISGKRYNLATGRDNKDLAQKNFHQLMAGRPETTAAGRRKQLTVQELCIRFLARAVRELKPTSISSYEQHLQMFVDKWGSLVATDVRPYHVSEWLDGRKWGPTTRARAVTTVKAAFSWGHRQGLLESDPVKLVEKPRAKTRILILSEAQAQAVADAYASTDPFRHFLVTIWDTGARPSEIRVITAADCQFDHGRVRLDIHKSDSTGVPRMIYLTPRVLEIFKALAKRYPEGPIFRNRSGRPWSKNAICQRFEGVRERLGYGDDSALGEGRELTAYAFRHLFVTRALLSGLSISDVAELVGHADTKMIMKVYNHLREHSAHLLKTLSKIKSEATDGPRPPDIVGSAPPP